MLPFPPAFLAGFYAGLTAPTALFSPAPSYIQLVPVRGIGPSFAAVGGYVRAATDQTELAKIGN